MTAGGLERVAAKVLSLGHLVRRWSISGSNVKSWYVKVSPKKVIKGSTFASRGESRS